jgi:hypothetical protein
VESRGRTSNNAWCTGGCEQDATVKGLYKKIEDAIDVPYANFESFQVLKYAVGQYYNVHHDQVSRLLVQHVSLVHTNTDYCLPTFYAWIPTTRARRMRKTG